TVVPEDRLRQASPFFADLWRLTAKDPPTAGWARAVREAARSTLLLLNGRASRAIRAPGAAPPVFDLSANDGVVNSALQLAEPDDASTLGGIVVADHADVLGYYDGVDALVAGPPLNESVFRSGA